MYLVCVFLDSIRSRACHPPTDGDKSVNKHQPFYEGQYSCSLEYVTGELDKRGVDWNKAFLIKGYFGDSLRSQRVQDLSIEKISIALVDCDLYSSTVDVFEFLEERLVDNAIVLMDDWKSYGGSADQGQPKAMVEFLNRASVWSTKELFDYAPYGRVFSLHRNDQ